MADYREFLASIAREAGALLAQRFHGTHTVDYKGEIDLVTEADRMSEELLISRISREYPHHDILAEESAETNTGSDYRWIIDPLDGTTNYAHGFPVFCVSIALEFRGEVVVGAVYDPMRDELFLAEKGGGAFLNDSVISISPTEDIARGLLATGFPYDIREKPDNNINYFNEMALKAQAIRRAGSAAIDLAYVAAGRFDGFWELKLRPWDTAAGWLLVEEAGGRVSELSGAPYTLNSPSIMASNGYLHESMRNIFATIDPLDPRRL
jgi:myo-inositol-1(or 4)-monophosphatase